MASTPTPPPASAAPPPTPPTPPTPPSPSPSSAPAAAPSSAPAAAASSAGTKRLALPSRIYNGIVGSADRFVPARLRPLWMHPAGPKTVFFWAPLIKWGLVIAGISDLARPAEALSIAQCSALAATGIIWSRYSLVIIPKNWSLFSVNLFVAITQCTQLCRAFIYQMSLRNQEEEIAPK